MKNYSKFNDEKDPNTNVVTQRAVNQKQMQSDVVVPQRKSKALLTKKQIFEIKCYLRFLGFFAFNSGPIYVTYLIRSIRFMLDTYQEKIEEEKFSKTKFSLFFFIDYMLAFSIVLEYFIFFRGIFLYQSNLKLFIYSKDLSKIQLEYYHWSINCMIFIEMFTVFVSFNSYANAGHDDDEQQQNQNTQSKKNTQYEVHYQFGLLFTQQNYSLVGLGQYQKAYIAKLEKKSQRRNDRALRKELQKQVNRLMKGGNKDTTFFYFTLIEDEDQKKKTIQEPLSRQNQEKKTDIMDQLNQLGFRGRRHMIENFLWPHYRYTQGYDIVSAKSKWIVSLFVVLMKVIIPTIVYINPLSKEIMIYSSILVVFYMHFVSNLFNLLVNDDIRTKRYIYLALQKLISLDQYTSKKDKNQLLDITCSLSLQSWETVRHITLSLKEFKTTSYNFQFGFLRRYAILCLVAFMLCNFKISWLKFLHYCNEDIIVYNVHIDVVVVMALALVRVYYGSLFNDTFSEIKTVFFRIFIYFKLIHNISSVYDDLYTLYEFYFQQGMQNSIKNNIYRSVVKLIREYASLKVKEETSSLSAIDEIYDVQQIVSNQLDQIQWERVSELKQNMEKIAESVDQDEIHCQNIGMVDMDKHKFMKYAIFVGVSFVPSIFDKMGKYINQIM